jgi:hypothetical protein
MEPFFSYPVLFGLVHIWRACSTYLTVSVTLERYIAVCYPLMKAIKHRYLLVPTITFAILYNLPKFFEFRTLFVDGSPLYG